MRNSVMVLFLVYFVVFGAGISHATVDPDSDQIGIYFDPIADTVCATATPGIPFFAYLIITNPSSAEVWAIEFSLCAEFIGGGENPGGRIGTVWMGDPGLEIYADWCLDGKLMGFDVPPPRSGDNVVLAQLEYLLFVDCIVEFFLGPCPVQSNDDGLPAYLDESGVVVSLGISSGDPDLPVAVVNGDCTVVSVESKSFSELKCLFR